MRPGTRVQKQQRVEYDPDASAAANLINAMSHDLVGPVGTVIECKLDQQEHHSPTGIVTVRFDTGYIAAYVYNPPDNEESMLPDFDELADVTPKTFVNVYIEDRAYGGPEEGGWWYDTLDPDGEECHQYATEAEAAAALPAKQEWCTKQNSERRSDISSVLSEGRYVARLEAWPAESYPSHRPHYC